VLVHCHIGIARLVLHATTIHRAAAHHGAPKNNKTRPSCTPRYCHILIYGPVTFIHGPVTYAGAS